MFCRATGQMTIFFSLFLLHMCTVIYA
jgi:hypothetical protein